MEMVAESRKMPWLAASHTILLGLSAVAQTFVFQAPVDRALYRNLSLRMGGWT